MAMLCRRLCRGLLPASAAPYRLTTTPFFSTDPSTPFDNDELSHSDSHSATTLSSSSSSTTTYKRRMFDERPLEGGVDVGIYKAILVGQVGQVPFQRTLRNGTSLTTISLGTGGLNNRRIPVDFEEPNRDFDNSVQWHRVVVYNPSLGGLMMKNVQPGAILYVEGNMETKIFNDPVTGLARRFKEIAVRRNGRIVYLGSGGDFSPPNPEALRGVGYY